MTAIPVPIHEQRDASYDVIVGRGILGGLPALLAERCAAERYAVIADQKVAQLHGAALMGVLKDAGLSAVLHTFPAGEWNKTRETWAQLTDALLKDRLGRDGAVIAFGGGVAGDLGGFLAATYLRGLPYVQVPTTLLAMIDSSIGGKTGIDAPAGKNLVGAFHQPRLVLADVTLLGTLPRIQLAAGAAEALKHGIIADAAYAEAVAGDAAGVFAHEPAVLERLVRRSVEIKADIVARDEREGGLRQVLNFGHTVGHAIESCTGFDLLHGEAVAVGMLVEARLAEALGIAGNGLAAEVRALLACYTLPDAVPTGASTAALLEAMQLDKKVRRGEVRCALPARIGEMSRSDDGEWTVEIPELHMRQVLDISR